MLLLPTYLGGEDNHNIQHSRLIMTQTVAISQTISSLNEADSILNLQRTTEADFFLEWSEELPQLTEQEKQTLNGLKTRYLYYAADNAIAEGTIKIIIISPLLELANLCDPPLKIRAEKAVNIELEDREIKLQGFIDALVVQNKFWVIIIEAKKYGFNVSLALPQALAYMMANPNLDKPIFGMVTNGEDYIFIKLNQQTRQYDFSKKLTLSDRDNHEFYQVLQVMKRITTLAF